VRRPTTGEQTETGRVSFGQLLRGYRAAAGLTQEELAERAELSPRGIAYLESDGRSPHRATVRRLAAALQLDASGRRALDTAAQRPEQTQISSALTTPLTPIVGRERDLAAALGLLARPEVRLLALRVADLLGLELAEGVVAVALDTIQEPALVLLAIAHALRVPEEQVQTGARSGSAGPGARLRRLGGGPGTDGGGRDHGGDRHVIVQVIVQPPFMVPGVAPRHSG
jgi:transcriptional regulator with XRE-family HTH domain